MFFSLKISFFKLSIGGSESRNPPGIILSIAEVIFESIFDAKISSDCFFTESNTSSAMSLPLSVYTATESLTCWFISVFKRIYDLILIGIAAW